MSRFSHGAIATAFFFAFAACGGRLVVTDAGSASPVDAESDGGTCPPDPAAGANPCADAGPVIGACVYLYFTNGGEQTDPSALDIVCVDAHGYDDSSSFAAYCISAPGAYNGTQWYGGETCSELGLTIGGGCASTEDASGECWVTWYNPGPPSQCFSCQDVCTVRCVEAGQ